MRSMKRYEDKQRGARWRNLLALHLVVDKQRGTFSDKCGDAPPPPPKKKQTLPEKVRTEPICFLFWVKGGAKLTLYGARSQIKQIARLLMQFVLHTQQQNKCGDVEEVSLPLEFIVHTGISSRRMCELHMWLFSRPVLAAVSNLPT